MFTAIRTPESGFNFAVYLSWFIMQLEHLTLQSLAVQMAS